MRDVLFSVWEACHIHRLSLFLPPFLAPVGLHRKKWEPVGVCLDPLLVCTALCSPPIAGRRRSGCVYTLCLQREHVRNELQRRAAGGGQFISIRAFITRMHCHWPAYWADCKEECGYSRLSRELHWSDAFECTPLSTVTADGICVPLISKCYLYTATSDLNQGINTAFWKHVVCTHYQPLLSYFPHRTTKTD